MTDKIVPGHQILAAGYDRAEWLAERRKRIGSSEIGILFGTGFKGEYTLWLIKTGRLDDDDDREFLDRGRRFEGPVLDHWRKWYYPELISMRRAGLIVSGMSDVCSATPDRLSVCPIGKCVVEAKTASSRTGWGDDLNPDVPLSYIYQGLWHLAATGRDHVHFVVMINWRILHRIVYRDNDLITTMIDKAERWWADYVDTDTPPPATAKDEPALTKIRPTPDESHLLDDQELDLMHRILELKEQRDLINSAYDDACADLKSRLGSATAALWPDDTIAATWKPTKTIDGGTKAWMAKHPEISNRYAVVRETKELDTTRIAEDFGADLPDGLRYRRQFIVKPLEAT